MMTDLVLFLERSVGARLAEVDGETVLLQLEVAEDPRPQQAQHVRGAGKFVTCRGHYSRSLLQ